VKWFVAILLCVFAAQVRAEDFSVIVFPDNAEPALLQLDLTAAEKQADLSWRLFFTSFFQFFDRDRDGFWSEAETKRVFPLPLSGGRQLAPNFAGMDANGDGKLASSEIQPYYRKNGFTPVTIIVEVAGAETIALGGLPFHHLDRDGDGKLSAAELRQAVALLKRFDENEDEVLTATELFGTLRPAKVPPKTSLKLGSPEKAPPTTLKLAREGKSSLVGKGASFRLDASGLRLRVPGGVCSIAFDDRSATAGFVAAKDFYLAQFKAAAGDKPATKQLFEDDPTTQVLAGLFAVADCDGDGKLTRVELDAFFAVIEMGLASRVIVTVTDRGPNLFDLFDADGDGRLDLDELTRAAKTLPDELARDKPLTHGAVPMSYRLVVSWGPVGDSFGPVPFGAAAKPKPPAAIPARGPAWFRAMDKNGDGFVSPREFIGPPQLFAKFDANQDGRISVEEAEAAK
jgi:Ca2+-binding EF-hand superfamily protein